MERRDEMRGMQAGFRVCANICNKQARAASASKPKGKLSAQLQEQKKQTRIDTLTESSKNELLARDADAAAADRAYN